MYNNKDFGSSNSDEWWKILDAILFVGKNIFAIEKRNIDAQSVYLKVSESRYKQCVVTQHF